MLLLWSVVQWLQGKRQPFLNGILPPAFPGWLRIRPPHLPTVRALLSGRLEALLPGGLWNRCRDLHPGDWVYVTGLSQELREILGPVLTFIPSNFRHCPPSQSRDFQSTTNPPGNITRLSTRLMTGAFPVRSPKTWQHFAVSSPKQQRSVAMGRRFVSLATVSCIIPNEWWHWEVTWWWFWEADLWSLDPKVEISRAHYCPLVCILRAHTNFLHLQTSDRCFLAKLLILCF